MTARRFFCLAVFLLPALVFPPALAVRAAPQSVTDFSILPAPDASGRWGYVDASTGKILIAPKYIEAGFFYDGVAIVTQDYPDEAYDVEAYGGGTVPVIPTHQGIINRDGREIVEPIYGVERAYSSFGRDEERGFIPRLFRIRGGNGDIVFHADKGEIVPVGVHKEVRYTADGGVFCDGDYYDPDGKRHTPPSGCEIAWIESETGMFRVREEKEHDSLEGVMRRDDTVIVPVKYHEVDVVNTPDGALWLASRGDFSVKAAAAAAISTGSAPEIGESEDILTVDVYDAAGTVLRSFRARYNPNVSSENYRYVSKGKEYTVNARTGQPVPEPERPADGASGFQPFQKDGQWGVKNADGTVTMEPRYEKISDLGGGLFAATKEFEFYRDNWGLIDGNGREIMSFIYGGISACGYPSRATGPLTCKQWAHGAEPNTPYWLVNRDGSFITPRDKPYHGDFYFNEAGLAVVWRNGKHGVIDYTGKEVLPCIYQTVFDELQLNEGRERRGAGSDKKAADPAPKPAPGEALYRVELNGRWGLYDGTGKELIPVRYGFINVDIDERAGGWVGIQNADRSRSGLFNIRTGQIIPPDYGFVQVRPGFFEAFQYGRDGKQDAYILLNEKGKPFARYDLVEWFENAGLLAARKHRDGKYALLDKNGKLLTPFRYESVDKAEGPFVWCRTDDGKKLFYDTGKKYGGKVLVDGKAREYRIGGK